MAILQENKYGKSGVRLVKVIRNGAVHRVREWTVRVLLEGDFETAHTAGDNSKILPTDTMKNTVYSRAKESKAESMEEFAHELIDFLLRRNAQVSAAEVHIEQVMWKRLTIDGDLHPHSFMRGSDELQTTTIRRAKNGDQSLVSGLYNMIVLKTTKSAFEGYIKDDLTTLKEAADRLFETSVTASWLYRGNVTDYEAKRTNIRESMLRTFATHDSKSVQQTLFAMAEGALAAVPELLEITLTMPNIHNIPVDLKVFGQENANEVFMPISDPSGYIHARVTRD
ncbi:factor-independent urate hydroxylase [Terriglobus roseus]|uniref:Uricase n=1 Tax=Terriglobus roseus TaxID=392734 RepID=A0A1H4KR96_9BACT|nr:urate oxidase [Terriglobus roseus]SEB60756.1 urate oxidase [Terriglobus roseus]